MARSDYLLKEHRAKNNRNETKKAGTRRSDYLLKNPLSEDGRKEAQREHQALEGGRKVDIISAKAREDAVRKLRNDFAFAKDFTENFGARAAVSSMPEVSERDRRDAAVRNNYAERVQAERDARYADYDIKGAEARLNNPDYWMQKVTESRKAGRGFDGDNVILAERDALEKEVAEARAAQDRNRVRSFARIPQNNDFVELSEGGFYGNYDPRTASPAKYGEMTDEEVRIWRYLQNSKGKNGQLPSAEEYLQSLEEKLVQRRGVKMGVKARMIDNPIGRGAAALGLAALSGIKSPIEGTVSALTGEETEQGTLDYAAGYVRNDIDGALGVAYDLTQSTANMVPSILLGSLTGVPALGTASMGVSAAGNAYSDALRDGYSKGQAALYGGIVGASEAALQSILGGIGALGGKMSATSVLKKLVEKIPRAGLRAAVKLAGSGVSEATEEGLQTYIEAGLRKVIFDENFNLRDVSEDALYSAMLGALSAGLLEGPGVVAETYLENDIKSTRKNTVASGEDLRYNEGNASQMQNAEGKVQNESAAENSPYDEKKVPADFLQAVDHELLDFVGKVEAKEKETPNSYTFGKTTERMNEDIKRLTGIDTTSFRHSIGRNSIRHIFKKHGKNGKTDRSMANNKDIARIGYVIENYDNIELIENDVSMEFRDKNQKPAPMVKMSKRVDGTFYVVEAVPDTKAKKLAVVSAYIEKPSQQTRDVRAPLSNVRNASADNGSIDSISEKEPIVNKNVAGMDSLHNDFKAHNKKNAPAPVVRSAPFNVMSNEAVDARRTREAGIRSYYGFGEHGARTFADVMDSMPVDSLATRAFSAAYMAGRTNLSPELAELKTDLQIKAFEAGLRDYNAETKSKEENVKNVVSHGKKAGFDSKGKPADATTTQMKIVDDLYKAMGVKGSFADGLLGNAELRTNIGISPIARDFQREIEVDGEKRKVSIVYHAAHEIAMHRLMELAPKEGQAFINALYRHMNVDSVKSLAEAKREAYAAQGVKISLSEAMEEVAANQILALYNWDEAKFAEAVDRIVNGKNEQAKQGASKFKQILDSVIAKLKSIIAKLNPKERQEVQAELDEFAELRDLFEKAFAAAVAKNKEIAAQQTTAQKSTAGAVKHSIRRGFAAEIDAWDGTKNTIFNIGTTSKALQSIGVEDRKIIWHGKKIAEILRKHKNMTRDVIKQVPEIMENPIIVLKSMQSDSRVTMFGEVSDAVGNPILAVLELEPTKKGGELLDMNVVASAYGKESKPANFIKNSELLYLDPNKNRTGRWLNAVGLQLPSVASTHLGSIGTITYIDGKVNIKGVPYEQYMQGVENNAGKSSQKRNADSRGHELTAEQAQYFSDSKVRDENGNLLVMYQGSENDFTVFDRKKSKYSNLYGRGFYFTKSESHAKQYGNTKAYYLDIKNPVSTTETTITKAQMKKFLEAVAENEDYGIENYGYGATPESVLNSLYGKTDFLMLNDVSQTAIGDLVEAIELFNEVNGTEFDGIILDTETVTFRSEQAKLTGNENPTADPDIRFSLRDSGKKYTEKEYRDYGWARANDILSVSENENYRSKFADLKSGQVRFNRSKNGEYIIPVSDSSSPDVENTLVFAKGTIDKPIITSIIKILEYNETTLDETRRYIYDLGRSGIQPKTGKNIIRYEASDFRNSWYGQTKKRYEDNYGERYGRGGEENTGFSEGRDVNEKYSLRNQNEVSLQTMTNVRKAISDNDVTALAKYAEKGVISTEYYNQLVEQYGAIPKGENPHRDVAVPQKTEKNKKVSQTVRTILEAKATPDEAVPTIEKMVEDGIFSYDVYTDKQAIADAEKKLRDEGWTESYNEWLNAVNKGKVTKDTTVTGWALYNNAANIAATTTSETERREAVQISLTILDAMVRHQRSAAQALQATRILKKLSPETQLYGVQKSVQSLKRELEERYGDKAPDLKIDEDLAEEFLNAKTEEERTAAKKEIYKDIGRQMPSRFIDKWNAWRYLAMLGNPRTHIRNIGGNAGFAPIVAVKNLTATAIESAVYRVSGKKTARSKAFVGGSKADRALLAAAWKDYANVADMISNGGKYSDFAMANKAIEEGRQIFKTKPLEWARKKNSELLEKEDMWFSKPHYASALAQYCKANKITAEQLKRGKALGAAREYAIKEAQKATYRDTNEFSQWVSEVGRKKSDNDVAKAFKVVADGIMPFRKTPANILVRGLEYSPLGLLNGIKQAVWDVQRGEKTSAEAIDSISAGLTGTGLLRLGLYLAAQGLIRGHGEDDEEKEFKELMGHQAYALELPNGTSVTLDWLAPEALPFFVGVNLWEAKKSKKEELNFSTILQIVSGITEPMLEMSCLQGLNDAVESVGYASSNDMSGLVSFLSSAATSYLTQGIPTLGGQAERTGEENRMTTYTEKNAFLTRDMQYTLGKVSAKFPGWDYHQIPYIDAWGRKEASGNALKRGLNNFLNPAYTSTIETSSMEKELLRLYEKTGEDGVFPERADKYFTVDGKRKDLTAEEYVKYATMKGTKSYELVSDLVKSKTYKSLSDEEKAEAVRKAYDYANQKAKKAVANYKPETWVTHADKFGDNVSNFISFRTEVGSKRDYNGGKISKQEVVDIALGMAQSDSELWNMYLSEYNSKADVHLHEFGIEGEDYMSIIQNLDVVDQPNKSGKLGTYTNDEIAAAISMVRGLDSNERAELWQSMTGSTSTKNNPWR